MKKLRKPTIKKDWDSNRRVVVNPYGDKFVLGKAQARVVYNASMRIYKKRKARM